MLDVLLVATRTENVSNAKRRASLV